MVYHKHQTSVPFGQWLVESLELKYGPVTAEKAAILHRAAAEFRAAADAINLQCALTSTGRLRVERWLRSVYPSVEQGNATIDRWCNHAEEKATKHPGTNVELVVSGLSSKTGRYERLILSPNAFKWMLSKDMQESPGSNKPIRKSPRSGVAAATRGKAGEDEQTV